MNSSPDLTAREAAANAAQFAWKADDVFGRIAGRYDFLCDVFSFGIHRLWKRAVASDPHGAPRGPRLATSRCAARAA